VETRDPFCFFTFLVAHVDSQSNKTHLDTHVNHPASIQQLSSLSVTVDVFVFGNESSHLASVAPLASMTGGAVVAEDDFGEGFCKNLAAAARRRSLGARDSVLTIQVPPGMRVAQVIGPVAGMSREETALKTSTYGQTVARRATGDGKPRSETNANAFALKSAECSQVRIFPSFLSKATSNQPATSVFVHPEVFGQMSSLETKSESRAIRARRAHARERASCGVYILCLCIFLVSLLARGLPARLPNKTGSELNGCATVTHPGRFPF